MFVNTGLEAGLEHLKTHQEKNCKTTGPTYIIDIIIDTTNLTSKFEGRPGPTLGPTATWVLLIRNVVSSKVSRRCLY